MSRATTTRPARLACLATALLAALAPLPSPGQVTPEEHEKHHPGQGQKKAAVGEKGAAPGGMMGGMGGMMEGMGKPPPKELYPSLMSLPELTPEKRAEVERQAHERMQEGAALLGRGLDLLNGAAPGDFATMQEGTAQMRQGLALLESGLAARRTLAEGKAPREVALDWFKREMNLSAPPAPQAHAGPFGLSWFHFFVMAVLTAFAAAMIGMYFRKMRRAALLLQELTGGTAAAAPAARTAPAAAEPVPAAITQPAGKKWEGKLRVGRIFQETPDVKTFRLMNPLGGVLPLGHLPGQFLTVTVLVDGRPVKRSYTIASSPTQRDYAEITVKHKEGGEVSGQLHSRVQEGDLL